MKTISMLLIVAILVMVTGVAWGQYATWPEAFNAGTEQYNLRDYAAARDLLVIAKDMASKGEDKAFAGLYIGKTYFGEHYWAQAIEELTKVTVENGALPLHVGEAWFIIGSANSSTQNYEQAVIAFTQVLNTTNAHPAHKMGAKLNLGMIQRINEDYVSAATTFAEVISFPFSHMTDKETAVKLLGEMKEFAPTALANMDEPVEWTGFYCSSRAKQGVKNFTEAIDDLVSAITKLDKNDRPNREMLGEELESLVSLQATLNR